jgi:hypothetical protein
MDRRRRLLVTVAAACLGCLPRTAAAIEMQADGRVAPLEFARRHGFDSAEMRARHGASGLVRCGNAVGTAQLTLRNDVITTAAHVLIGTDGAPRASGSSCTFEPILGASGPVPIDTTSIAAGSRNPLAEPATRDWAVARLTRPVRGAAPYRLSGHPASGHDIVMCGGGHGTATRIAAESCAVRAVGASADGTRELRIDCNAGPGTSGAAMVTEDHTMLGIYVGYRSTAPDKAQPFSDRHYNFGITIEGPFRRAVLELAAGSGEEVSRIRSPGVR